MPYGDILLLEKNVLNKIEHYIPVLEEYQARVQRRRYLPRGLGKKRQRKKASMKYVMPLFDDDMEGHSKLKALLSTKSKGKGQCYTYYVSDKKCTLVFSRQMERAIRDKDIIDTKITLPLVSYDGRAPFYRGEGWTRKEIEETHHHGRETMNVAKLFEAKEQGVEEWELEMMRMASKRKKKHRGEGTADWKAMMAATAENVDWDKFEEEAKQVVEEANQPIDDEPIAMAVDDMDKTANVNEKLKNAGEDILSKLPVMPEIPEIINIIKDQGDLTEIANVTGMTVNLQSNNAERFVPGQMVQSEDGELFVPGQTVTNEEGVSEYTPGFTVLLDNEPTLIPGLVMGDEPDKAMFLPGESTITESGELQFTEMEDDFRELNSPSPVQPEVEEVELEEEQNSEEEEEERRPPPKREKKEFVYERPKRQYTENMGPKHRERGPKKVPPRKPFELKIDWDAEPKPKSTEPVFFDLSRPMLEKDLLLQEKERVSVFTEKKAKEEVSIDKKRREIKLKAKQLIDNKPVKPKYVPLEPVTKSEKLKELEKSIKKDALRRKIITGQNILGNRIEHYIPVFKPHDEKAAERRRRGKGVVIVKKKNKEERERTLR
ncbi:hypothetical protein NQ314_010648 [Rhamnusium bicolor]|uniref:Ribosome biogenesis protein NOP53 n=1 Tax=Rhamnusium bicolor TaxID=1586634 RepID=A0AAV8XP87_9CUCU|nr:hypothetical protein NQ314_010648 [Rhamnusium bicolor]